MLFSNYNAYSNTYIFDDAQYVRYNRQRQIYEPIRKYGDYRFMTSGFENMDPDEVYYKEVPYKTNQ